MEKINTILLVDDDDTGNFVTKMFFLSNKLSVQLEVLENGKEAVDYFDSRTTDFPDLVLLDINMPLMNGFEFLEWYEDNGFTGKTKIAMFSSSIREDDKQKALPFQDVVEYIEKPLTLSKFKMITDKLTKSQDD
ncbi:response regulator [Reichenbachiella sp. MALMAid0571]|uniref:response regulator n=1 Tax=Reichenbachiella sp. MALMAid0571 TaxID=3143939 RepID=UPI0032E017A0